MGSSEAVTTQSKCLSPFLRGTHPHKYLWPQFTRLLVHVLFPMENGAILW